VRESRSRLAVLGNPLDFTRSPELHRAGLETLGLRGSSEALRTSPEDLAARLAELAAHGYRGVNLTHPLKECVLPLLARVSEAARLARSVNTVGFESDGWWGDTTDGPGFVDWLGSLGRDPARQRVMLLGGGGAARSLALALRSAGADQVAASLRRPERAEASWRGIPQVRRVAWRSTEEARLLRGASLVVNATPLAEGPAVPLSLVPRRALVLDLVYGPGPTPWVLAARAEGREAYDGLGLLVFQARRALALWYVSAMPVDSLASAVGWPR
jgi:shikimate dehydrogenase